MSSQQPTISSLTLNESARILNALNNGIIKIDPGFTIEFANGEMERLTGWKPEEIIGKNLFDLLSEDTDPDSPTMQLKLNSIKQHLLPCYFLCKDDSFTPVLMNSTPIFSRTNSPQGAVITLRDNTEEITCSAILDSLADAVFAVDKNWTITFFNRAAETMTGRSAQDVIGKSCSDVFQSSSCGKNCTIAESLYLGRPVFHRFQTIHDSRGNRLPVSISSSPLTDTAGNIIGGVEIIRDLTTISRQRKVSSHKHYFDRIISQNNTMKRLFQIMPEIAASPSNVMITGESGTGKELAALAIHNNSDRKDKPFVAVNCGALPETLLESELFGYKAGAFTDARKDKEGRFAAAEGGTLFLDEIGDIPPSVQTKLLRVLQERMYEPLGSNTPVNTDIRIITATNKDLKTAVRTGDFREDLFYRLSVVRVQLPPLRERKEDIPLLIEHFIEKYNRKQGKDIIGITNATLQALMNYHYPGNIRELENIIEYAFILCEGNYIQPENLPDPLAPDKPSPATPATTDDYQPLTLEEMEKQFILQALQRNDWKRLATCKELGVSKDTLRRKIQKFSLENDISGFANEFEEE